MSYMIRTYSVRDLGENFSSWEMNYHGDVVGRQQSAMNDVPSIHLANGTVITLPLEIVSAVDINDNGLVLGRLKSGQSVVFDITTATVEPISIPGFPNVRVSAINNNGDLAGTAARGPSVSDDMRGFILNGKTRTVTWVFPTIALLPPGATPFLELNDLNNHGHAVGTQGWVRGLDQLEVPIFYNGNVVTSIGSPVFIANGILITNTGRMHVWYHPNNFSEMEAIYDAGTNTLTPFLNGSIIDLNASGEVLWESPWPSSDDYLTSASNTRQLGQLFPAGSGWSATWAHGMNDHGDIIGGGSIAGEFHGYILTTTYHIKDIEEGIAQILWGIINDAGGVGIISGFLYRVPPYSPLRELLNALPNALRQELVAAIDQARFDEPTGVRAFSFLVRGIVEGYRRQNL